MLTRREALIGAASAGVALLFRDTAHAADVPQPSTKVTFKVPPGACDTHVHVFPGESQYPYAPTSGYRHPPSTADDLLALQKALLLSRVCIIQPSGYGTDNRATLDGVKQLGARARAVVAIDEKTPDSALDTMHRGGARGIRLGVGQSVQEASQRLQQYGDRLKGRNWHINTAVNLGMLQGLSDQFMKMPVPVVIDHWVSARPELGPSQPGFDTLLQLLKSGKVYLKITHRIHTLSKQAPDFPDAIPLAKAVIAANPQRILWGTDWPHAGIRPQGYTAKDVSPYVQIDDGRLFNQFPLWAVNQADRQAILVDNPARLYDF